MSVLQSTTGHSRIEEQFVAKELYIAIIFSIIVALAGVFVVSRHPSFNFFDDLQRTPAVGVPGKTVPAPPQD